jgi:hypothetical protein
MPSFTLVRKAQAHAAHSNAAGSPSVNSLATRTWPARYYVGIGWFRGVERLRGRERERRAVDRHHRVIELFEARDLDIGDTEECVELLADVKLRAEFQVLLKAFFATLDLVLPRPDALPYVGDAKRLAALQVRARHRYRTAERPIGAEVGAKVRKLIDDHIVSLGIDPKVPPLAITDTQFDHHVEKHRSPKAKASEMEHALRHHLRKHFDEDPERFEALSKRLDRMLEEMKDKWDELVEALGALKAEVTAGRKSDDTGLDPERQAPFLGVLRQELSKGAEVSPEALHEARREERPSAADAGPSVRDGRRLSVPRAQLPAAPRERARRASQVGGGPVQAPALGRCSGT